MATECRAIHITGVVQGVGFRPFVYTLAQRHGLVGWVQNTSGSVEVRVEGSSTELDAFVESLQAERPPLARIDSLTVEGCAEDGFTAFSIRESAAQPGAFQPVSPDMGLCDDCRRELRDPNDPRYRYPFINCTNCGPRFTIITDVPYDRPLTTMGAFDMCARCESAYHDPTDRRFHAQPIACPGCGPHVWLTYEDGVLTHDPAIRTAADLLRQGSILAIKGLGGFHLACDATNPHAVAELRRRKRRIDKPFALMAPDLETVERHCLVTDAECVLLTSQASPIVLLNRRGETGIAPAVAPKQTTLGFMLPYTPLHVLLLDDVGLPLVMTSGNLSDEPIVTDNDDALAKLDTLADAFLLHNRDIHVRTDDSVMRVFAERELPVRRSRGYAPYPVHLPFDLPPTLAVGGEMKNTFCVTRARYAFMSHHIGNMANYETLRSFEDGIAHFEGLFRVTPAVIAYDKHPDYLATRYAHERAERDGITAVPVRHHHAHVAACMAENGHTGQTPVIGVSFDGTGYGDDGTIWGGEFLIADYARYRRAAHLKAMPLPGGDAATRRPARIALAYLLASGLPIDDDLPPLQVLTDMERSTVIKQVASGLNTPLTSAAGRLFDAVSALLGVNQAVTYEAQAAIELEAIADTSEERAYTFGMDDDGVLDPAPVLAAVVADWRAGVPDRRIAMRFHNGLAAAVAETCERLRARFDLDTVALTGGVFQNVTLLERTLDKLRAAGFNVLLHHLVPPNDGGLALGQAVIANAIMRIRDVTGG